MRRESYEFSLGLNGLGLCSTQYASEYMDVPICRDGFVYELHFKKGEPSEEMKKNRHQAAGYRYQPCAGSRIWRCSPTSLCRSDYYRDILKRQAVVNPGVQFLLRNEKEDGSFAEEEFFYENGIARTM